MKCAGGYVIEDGVPCPRCGAHRNQSCGEAVRKAAEILAAKRAEEDGRRALSEKMQREPDKRTQPVIIETF